jgi:hypothetical protein
MRDYMRKHKQNPPTACEQLDKIDQLLKVAGCLTIVAIILLVVVVNRL